MMNITLSRRWLGTALLACSALLTACDPDDDEAALKINPGDVLVLNEGAFNKADASVSVFVPSSKGVTSDIYGAVNGRGLGDVAQSMVLSGNNGYIVVNNSNKMEVVTLPTFRSTATINRLSLPRYMAVNGNRGYVTEIVNYKRAKGRMAVIDLATNTWLDTVQVGRQPQGVAVAGGKVFVANGGENTISVIDAATNRVETTLTVGDGPYSLTVDRNGRVWALCGGRIVYNGDYTTDYTRTTPGTLVSFLPTAPYTVTQRTFPSNRSAPGNLQLNGAKDQLYYTYQGGVYRLGINDNALPPTPLIRRRFYGIGVDPKDNTVYGAIESFSGAGKVIRYKDDGTALDSLTAGIGPNSFLFY